MGLVTRAGAPEAGRIVGVATYAGACPPADTAVDLNVMARYATTDGGGRYRLEVRSPLSAPAVCVRVSAYGPVPAEVGVGPPLLATAERGGFRLGVGPGGRPLDSARVDLALP
jgi:hypothetical protein